MTCLVCALDFEDCTCESCICEGCIMNGCPCTRPEQALDQMVANASVPNLGALFRAGQKSGLIKPVKAYSSTV